MKIEKKEKGEFGYINYIKIKQLVITFISMFMVAAIFYTGVIRYGNTKSIFTVIAAVAAIPTAKVAVSYLIMFKRKSIDSSIYHSIHEASGEAIDLYELSISSTEKIMPFESIVIRDNSVYALSMNEKTNVKMAAKYIREFLETENKISTVKIFNSEKEFISNVKQICKNSPGKYDENIKKLLLIYSL